MNEVDAIRSLGEGESLGPEARASALTKLRSSIQAEPPARVRSIRHRRVAALAAVGASLAVVIVAGLLSVTSPPARAAVLTRLASVAETRPYQPVGPGQYVYTKSMGEGTTTSVDVSNGETRTTQVGGTREAWIGPDGSGRIIDSATDQVFGPGELTFLDLSGLPTDPSALLRVIGERQVVEGPPGDAETFDIVGDLLRETAAPPEVRAALFRAAAMLPGVEEIELATDHLGRRGFGVAFTDDGLRTELVFDPQTSLLLGEQLARVTGSGTVEVESWIVYLETSIVDSTMPTP